MIGFFKRWRLKRRSRSEAFEEMLLGIRELRERAADYCRVVRGIQRIEDAVRYLRKDFGDLSISMMALKKEITQFRIDLPGMAGAWGKISEADAQRLMSVSGGEMTPVFIEWFIATHSREESLARYGGDRLRMIPPYLREKLQ